MRRAARAAPVRRFRPLANCDAGATAIEFSLVALPFLMFVFGLLGCALYFFIMNSLERGMDQTSRLVRTGQAVSQAMTVHDFKQSICTGAGGWIQCNSLQIFVGHYKDWASVTTQPCVDSQNNVITNPAKDNDPIATYSGAASDVVLVTACYKWNTASKVPFLHLGNMPDGAMMMQTTTAFRSEPYPTS